VRLRPRHDRPAERSLAQRSAAARLSNAWREPSSKTSRPTFALRFRAEGFTATTTLTDDIRAPSLKKTSPDGGGRISMGGRRRSVVGRRDIGRIRVHGEEPIEPVDHRDDAGASDVGVGRGDRNRPVPRERSTSTVTTASVPPVIASTWYESSSKETPSPAESPSSAARTASSPASTGPDPVPEATRSLSPTRSRTEAVGRFPPEVADRSTSSTCRSLAALHVLGDREEVGVCDALPAVAELLHATHDFSRLARRPRPPHRARRGPL